MPMSPDRGEIAQERTFSVPQLVRAAYGDFQPALLVLLRRPWARMHSAFYNYVHYRNRFGATPAGEAAWANESVGAFRRCERRFGTDHCALSFESLVRENEEVFYHCDQLIKGMYSVFLPRWRREHSRLLFLQQQIFSNHLAEANRLGEVGRKDEMKRIWAELRRMLKPLCGLEMRS